MVYTYVTNGITIDFNYIRKELIRLDKFKEYQSWLDKTYIPAPRRLGLYILVFSGSSFCRFTKVFKFGF